MILFFLFGLSIAFFLFLLTLVKRNKNNADRILAAWMAFMTIHLAFFVMDYAKVSYEYPHLLGIILPLPILHGFFLYCYTLQTTTNRFPGIKVIFLHLIPFFTLVVLAIPFYLLSPEEKQQVYENEGAGYEWYSTIQIVLFVVAGLCYSIVSILQIKKHRKQMLNVFSNTEKKTLIWLEWMSLGLGCIWLLAFFFEEEVIFSGVVLFVIFIGVFGISQTPVFFASVNEDKFTDVSKNSSLDEQTSEKYQKSGLTEDDATRLSDVLETFMKLNKPYKNPDLTLDELAALIKANPYQLSQVINSRVGKTFYHYINSYRIKEFLTLAALPDSNKFTYLGLASDCGFQSKTTFNKYFKIETGKTPSEYFQTAKAA
jgi:AraC-like DNA-binding protein